MLESQGFDTKMAGLVVFRSLSEALKAGFQIYDRTSDGYLVRTRTSTGWAMALVNVKA
jgi:Ca2+-binding EF-hand superfamily protein